MTRTNTSLPSMVWRRNGTEWLLVVGTCTVARIERDGDRWLCSTDEDDGGDTFVGRARTLASAKAFLARRCAAGMAASHALEQPPL